MLSVAQHSPNPKRSPALTHVAEQHSQGSVAEQHSQGSVAGQCGRAVWQGSAACAALLALALPCPCGSVPAAAHGRWYPPTQAQGPTESLGRGGSATRA